MKISKNWSIDGSPNNYVLQERIKGKSGLTDKVRGYYPTIESALLGCLNEKGLRSKAKDMKAFLKELKKIKKEIVEVVNENSKKNG